MAGRNAGGVAVRRPSAPWTGFNREEEVVVCSHRPWEVGGGLQRAIRHHGSHHPVARRSGEPGYMYPILPVSMELAMDSQIEVDRGGGRLDGPDLQIQLGQARLCQMLPACHPNICPFRSQFWLHICN